jgi:hypothetical protein
VHASTRHPANPQDPKEDPRESDDFINAPTEDGRRRGQANKNDICIMVWNGNDFNKTPEREWKEANVPLCAQSDEVVAHGRVGNLKNKEKSTNAYLVRSSELTRNNGPIFVHLDKEAMLNHLVAEGLSFTSAPSGALQHGKRCLAGLPTSRSTSLSTTLSSNSSRPRPSPIGASSGPAGACAAACSGPAGASRPTRTLPLPAQPREALRPQRSRSR